MSDPREIEKAIEDFKEAVSGTFKSIFSDIKLEGAGMSEILALGVAKKFASGGIAHSSSARVAFFDRGEFVISKRSPIFSGQDEYKWRHRHRASKGFRRHIRRMKAGEMK